MNAIFSKQHTAQGALDHGRRFRRVFKDARVLTIDPYYRGFSFAVLEGADSLIAWGMRKATKDKNARCLTEIAKLVARYQPEVVTLADYAGRRSHRSAR